MPMLTNEGILSIDGTGLAIIHMLILFGRGGGGM